MIYINWLMKRFVFLYWQKNWLKLPFSICTDGYSTGNICYARVYGLNIQTLWQASELQTSGSAFCTYWIEKQSKLFCWESFLVSNFVCHILKVVRQVHVSVDWYNYYLQDYGRCSIIVNGERRKKIELRVSAFFVRIIVNQC